MNPSPPLFILPGLLLPRTSRPWHSRLHTKTCSSYYPSMAVKASAGVGAGASENTSASASASENASASTRSESAPPMQNYTTTAQTRTQTTTPPAIDNITHSYFPFNMSPPPLAGEQLTHTLRKLKLYNVRLLEEEFLHRVKMEQASWVTKWDKQNQHNALEHDEKIHYDLSQDPNQQQQQQQADWNRVQLHLLNSQLNQILDSIQYLARDLPHVTSKAQLSQIKLNLRKELWNARENIESRPISPSKELRRSMEEARAALLDASFESKDEWEGFRYLQQSTYSNVSITNTHRIENHMENATETNNPLTSALNQQQQPVRSFQTIHNNNKMSSPSSMARSDMPLHSTLNLVVQDNRRLLLVRTLRKMGMDLMEATDLSNKPPFVPNHVDGPSSSDMAKKEQGQLRLNHLLRDMDSALSQLYVDDLAIQGMSRLSEALDAFTTEFDQLELEQGHTSLHIQQLVEDLRTVVFYISHVSQVDVVRGEAMLLRPRTYDIPNFQIVNDTLLRGGQPNEQGIKWLIQYGVRTAVDLRGDDRSNQWTKMNHQAWGPIRCLNIEIQDFQTPSLEQVYMFVKLLSDPSCLPVFVHCKAGVGRTGTLVACWRISQGEDVDVALSKERLHSEDGGGLRQEGFVKEFARIWQRTQNT